MHQVWRDIGDDGPRWWHLVAWYSSPVSPLLPRTVMMNREEKILRIVLDKLILPYHTVVVKSHAAPPPPLNVRVDGWGGQTGPAIEGRSQRSRKDSTKS